MFSVPGSSTPAMGASKLHVSILPLRQDAEHIGVHLHSLRHRPRPLQGYSLPSHVSTTADIKYKIVSTINYILYLLDKFTSP